MSRQYYSNVPEHLTFKVKAASWDAATSVLYHLSRFSLDLDSSSPLLDTLIDLQRMFKFRVLMGSGAESKHVSPDQHLVVVSDNYIIERRDLFEILLHWFSALPLASITPPRLKLLMEAPGVVRISECMHRTTASMSIMSGQNVPLVQRLLGIHVNLDHLKLSTPQAYSGNSYVPTVCLLAIIAWRNADMRLSGQAMHVWWHRAIAVMKGTDDDGTTACFSTPVINDTLAHVICARKVMKRIIKLYPDIGAIDDYLQHHNATTVLVGSIIKSVLKRAHGIDDYSSGLADSGRNVFSGLTLWREHMEEPLYASQAINMVSSEHSVDTLKTVCGLLKMPLCKVGQLTCSTHNKCHSCRELEVGSLDLSSDLEGKYVTPVLLHNAHIHEINWLFKDITSDLPFYICDVYDNITQTSNIVVFYKGVHTAEIVRLYSRMVSLSHKLHSKDEHKWLWDCKVPSAWTWETLSHVLDHDHEAPEAVRLFETSLLMALHGLRRDEIPVHILGASGEGSTADNWSIQAILTGYVPLVVDGLSSTEKAILPRIVCGMLRAVTGAYEPGPAHDAHVQVTKKLDELPNVAPLTDMVRILAKHPPFLQGWVKLDYDPSISAVANVFKCLEATLVQTVFGDVNTADYTTDDLTLVVPNMITGPKHTTSAFVQSILLGAPLKVSDLPESDIQHEEPPLKRRKVAPPVYTPPTQPIHAPQNYRPPMQLILPSSQLGSGRPYSPSRPEMDIMSPPPQQNKGYSMPPLGSMGF